MTMTAAQVVTAVRRHFGAERDGLGPEWAALDEFSLGTGAGRQRADLFLVRAWSSRPKGHERVLIEVKVSRADLRHELANPHKIEPFAELAHRVYFATPKGLVRDDEDLGAGVGLLEVSPAGRVTQARQAQRRPDPAPVPEGAFVEAFRRAARGEARIRGASGGDPAAQVVELTAQLHAAERARDTARQAARRDQDRLRRWMNLLAGVGGAPCQCGATLKVGVSGYDFRHADGSTCPRWAAPDPEALARILGLGESSHGSSHL